MLRVTLGREVIPKRKMKKTVFVIAQLFVVGMAAAAPLTLKCSLPDGTPTSDLVVDIEKKTLVWGGFLEYTIHAVDDLYISAFKKSGVGGEVWVLNRTTGDYLRSGVSVSWDSPESFNRNVPGKLSASTYSGRCTKPLL